MSEDLTNEEIREKLIKLNYDCGPVTDTTRKIYLKKFEALKHKSSGLKTDAPDKISDDELRSKLISLGYSPGPITSQNRTLYVKKLEKLKLEKNKSNTQECSFVKKTEDFKSINASQVYEDFDEPMDID